MGRAPENRVSLAYLSPKCAVLWCKADGARSVEKTTKERSKKTASRGDALPGHALPWICILVFVRSNGTTLVYQIWLIALLILGDRAVFFCSAGSKSRIQWTRQKYYSFTRFRQKIRVVRLAVEDALPSSESLGRRSERGVLLTKRLRDLQVASSATDEETALMRNLQSSKMRVANS